MMFKRRWLGNESPFYIFTDRAKIEPHLMMLVLTIHVEISNFFDILISSYFMNLRKYFPKYILTRINLQIQTHYQPNLRRTVFTPPE